MNNLSKLDSIIRDYTYMVEFLDKYEQERLNRRLWIDVIEKMYENGDVDFKRCGWYVWELFDLEKAEVYKYIKWQNSNKDQNVYDYIINILNYYK